MMLYKDVYLLFLCALAAECSAVCIFNTVRDIAAVFKNKPGGIVKRLSTTTAANKNKCTEKCCETDPCNVAVFHGKDETCFLFKCQPLASCRFTNDNSFTVHIVEKTQQHTAKLTQRYIREDNPTTGTSSTKEPANEKGHTTRMSTQEQAPGLDASGSGPNVPQTDNVEKENLPPDGDLSHSSSHKTPSPHPQAETPLDETKAAMIPTPPVEDTSGHNVTVNHVLPSSPDIKTGGPTSPAPKGEPTKQPSTTTIHPSDSDTNENMATTETKKLDLATSSIEAGSTTFKTPRPPIKTPLEPTTSEKSQLTPELHRTGEQPGVTNTTLTTTSAVSKAKGTTGGGSVTHDVVNITSTSATSVPSGPSEALQPVESTRIEDNTTPMTTTSDFKSTVETTVSTTKYSNISTQNFAPRPNTVTTLAHTQVKQTTTSENVTPTTQHSPQTTSSLGQTSTKISTQSQTSGTTTPGQQSEPSSPSQSSNAAGNQSTSIVTETSTTAVSTSTTILENKTTDSLSTATTLKTSTEGLTNVANGTLSQSAKASGSNQSVMLVVLISALSIGVLFFFAVLVLVGRRVFESWQRRHYSRIDYLVNGMYN